MHHYLAEHRKYVEITGYRSASFASAEAYLKAHRRETQKVDIQLFDADLIATEWHLYFAVLNALQAFRSKTNISKTPAMETMLYASAKRQIQKAIDLIGIKPQTKNVAVVLLGDDPKQVQAQLQALSASIGCVPDDSVLQLTIEKQKKICGAFGVSAEMLKVTADGSMEKALVDLIVERIALLATEL